MGRAPIRSPTRAMVSCAISPSRPALIPRSSNIPIPTNSRCPRWFPRTKVSLRPSSPTSGAAKALSTISTARNERKIMLEVKGLSVEVHGKPILVKLDLTVKAGEVAAIMGPNGSGKSTLSYLIAGKPEYEATAGEVLLDGENILELSPEDRKSVV